MSAAPTSSGPSALVKVGLAVAAVAAVGAGLAYAMWPGSKPVAKKTSRSNSPTQQHAAAKKKKKQADKRAPPPASASPPLPAGAGFLNRNSGSDTGSTPAASLKSHGRVGADYAAKREWKRAAESFTLAIQEEPENNKLYTNRANVYISMVRPEDALRDSIKSLELKVTPGALLAKGNALLLLEQFDAAIEVLQLVSQQPDATPAHTKAASVKVEQATNQAIAQRLEQEEAARIALVKKQLAAKAEHARQQQIIEQAKEAQLAAEAKQAALAAAAVAAQQAADEAQLAASAVIVPEVDAARSYSLAVQEHAKIEDESAVVAAASAPAPVVAEDAEAAQEDFNPDEHDGPPSNDGSDHSNSSGVLINASDVHSDNEHGSAVFVEAEQAAVEEQAPVAAAEPVVEEEEEAAPAAVAEPVAAAAAEEPAAAALSASPVLVSPVVEAAPVAAVEALVEPEASAAAAPVAAVEAEVEAEAAAAAAAPEAESAAPVAAAAAPAPKRKRGGQKKPAVVKSQELNAEQAAAAAAASSSSELAVSAEEDAAAAAAAAAHLGPQPMTPPPVKAGAWAKPASAQKPAAEN